VIEHPGDHHVAWLDDPRGVAAALLHLIDRL
jgi:hypothetical protein